MLRPSSRDGQPSMPQPAILPVAGPESASKLIVRGRERILALQPVLCELAELTGQPGDANDLALFLSGPHTNGKQPVLVLSRADPGEPSIRNLKDASLLFEYTRLGRGLRVFASADWKGRRTLFAPAPLRASTAASTAATLVAHGAHLVHLAFRPDPSSSPQDLLDPVALFAAEDLPTSARFAVTQKLIPLYLPLGPTFDATLARIGQRTRSNLRYYRRRTERELGCVYLPEARFALPDFLAFTRRCMYPVPDSLATWRFQALKSVERPLLAGIQDRDARWLSVVGGRRRGSEVEIDWQMNHAGHPHLSLSTVLRACLIEHEVALGSSRLYIEAGSPQPIGQSFAREHVQELTLTRNSPYVRLLSRFATTVFPEKNYIGQVLTDPNLTWHTR